VHNIYIIYDYQCMQIDLSIQIPMNDPVHVNDLIYATHLMMICLLHLLDILTCYMLD